MKTVGWQNFFAEQKALHGKVIFSVAELANVAQTTLHTLNTQLGRLLKRGVIHRYGQGRYGSVQDVAPEAIVSALDPGAYVTGFYALFQRNLVTQLPSELTCFSDRRHNRKSERVTLTARLRFICVPPVLYAKPRGEGSVPAEQALCDFVWLTLRDGLQPQSLVTFRNLHTLNKSRLLKTLRRYPQKVGDAVGRLIPDTVSWPPPAKRRSRLGTRSASLRLGA